MYTVFTQAHQSRHNNCSLRAYHTDPLTRLYAQYMLKMKTTRPVLRWWHSIQYCHGSHGPMNLKIKNTAIDHEMKSHWTAGRKKADGCMHLKALTRFQLHMNWNEAPVGLVRVLVEVLVLVMGFCGHEQLLWLSQIRHNHAHPVYLHVHQFNPSN